MRVLSSQSHFVSTTEQPQCGLKATVINLICLTGVWSIACQNHIKWYGVVLRT